MVTSVCQPLVDESSSNTVGSSKLGAEAVRANMDNSAYTRIIVWHTLQLNSTHRGKEVHGPDEGNEMPIT